MKPYATPLGLLYPLGHPIDLDLAWDPWHTSTYHSDGTEGRWYVAGWSGSDGINLNRDRMRALTGEWHIGVTLQRVIGSDQWVWNWERDHDKGRGGERIAMVERETVGVTDAAGVVWTVGTRAKIADQDNPGGDVFPCGSVLLCHTEKESIAYTDDDRDARTGKRWCPVGSPWSTLRQEWAIAHLEHGHEHASDPFLSVRVSGDWLLFHRYIRRGVREPWSLFDGSHKSEHTAVRGIGCWPLPIPDDPRYALYVHEHIERADFEAVRALEREIEEREREERRRHHYASEDAFRRLLEGKDEEGKRLAREYNATISHIAQERKEIVADLERDEGFMARYQAVMDAERVPAKKRAVKEVLRWLWVEKRVMVKSKPETEKETA